MKSIYTNILLSIFILAGCAPATSIPTIDIELAIQQTLTAQPADTSTPTLPPPTLTPTFLPTSSPTKEVVPTSIIKPTETLETNTLEELQDEFVELLIQFLEDGEGLEDIESVTLVRLNDDGILEIELKSRWASRDSQPDLSFTIISWFSVAFSEFTEETFYKLANGHDLIFSLTTYSTDGDYRYKSETNVELLHKLYQKKVSYEEWVQEANAGFR